MASRRRIGKRERGRSRGVGNTEREIRQMDQSSRAVTLSIHSVILWLTSSYNNNITTTINNHNNNHNNHGCTSTYYNKIHVISSNNILIALIILAVVVCFFKIANWV